MLVLVGNRLVPVSLPSPNHDLVVPTHLGSLDTSLVGVVGAGEAATGLVQLVDKNVAPGEIVKTPTADLNIVIPARLELSVLPHKSWTLLTEREVIVTIDIYDEEGSKVHLSAVFYLHPHRVVS